MYQFHDYFDPLLVKQPYTNAGEELEDYLRFLDMLLENYTEYKGAGSSKKLFSRGLVITESEMQSYFEMPPYFRERDICDPVLSGSTEAALDYIDARVNLTKQYLSKNISSKLSKSDREAAEKSATRTLLRIEYLKDLFSLTPQELLAVLLALAVEIDRRYERIFGFLQDDISKTTPTIGLLNALISRITVRMGPEETIPQPLDERMYTYFFVRNDRQDRLHSGLVLQPLMKKVLMGAPETDKSTSAIFRVYEEQNNIPVFFTESFSELSFILSNEGGEQEHTGSYYIKNAVYAGNDDRDTVLHLLYKYCTAHSEQLYVLDLFELNNLTQDTQKTVLADLFLRLKLYNGRLAVKYIFDEDREGTHPGSANTGQRNLLEEICRICDPKNVVIFGRKEEPGELASMLVPFLKIPDPSVMLRTKIWTFFLKTQGNLTIAKDVNIPDLSDCYEIPYGMIQKAVRHADATSQTKPDAVIDRRQILDSLRQLNQVDFSGLATYVNPAYTWEDITITETQKEIMKTACDRHRLRNRIGEGWGLKRKNAYGNGISLLLYGPPGTGKTMAAQVIANELALPMYRVDISQISSKYIGETEKNLATIFTAATKANVILFFDEADALFSKRTDVSDSHDKYANNETAYLLQKIEEYNGMSILATNYYNNFDDAFIRRITYAVHMESPDEKTRYALWTTILPPTAKMEEGIDFKYLAKKFELSGSNIKAILFNAAYMAGAEKKAIGPKHIVRAMEYEFEKLGKLVNGSDFGEFEKYLRPAEQKKTPVRRNGR